MPRLTRGFRIGGKALSELQVPITYDEFARLAVARRTPVMATFARMGAEGVVVRRGLCWLAAHRSPAIDGG